MGKRKTEKQAIEEVEDIEAAAYHLATLLSIVNPKVDLPLTYEFVLALLEEDLNEESVRFYGAQILKTIKLKGEGSHHAH